MLGMRGKKREKKGEQWKATDMGTKASLPMYILSGVAMRLSDSSQPCYLQLLDLVGALVNFMEVPESTAQVSGQFYYRQCPTGFMEYIAIHLRSM